MSNRTSECHLEGFCSCGYPTGVDKFPAMEGRLLLGIPGVIPRVLIPLTSWEGGAGS